MPATVVTGPVVRQPRAATWLSGRADTAAADETVDDQRLEPCVPRAPTFGRAGVDPRRGEGDLPAEPQQFLAQHALVTGSREQRHLFLRDGNGLPHEFDRVLQRHGPGHRAWRRGEHLARQAQHVVGRAQPLDKRRDARLGDQHHPGALVGRQRAKPGQLVVHAGHALRGHPTCGLLDLAQACPRAAGASRRRRALVATLALRSRHLLAPATLARSSHNLFARAHLRPLAANPAMLTAMTPTARAWVRA